MDKNRNQEIPEGVYLLLFIVLVYSNKYSTFDCCDPNVEKSVLKVFLGMFGSEQYSVFL